MKLICSRPNRYVDIDSRGQRCKERKSTVLCRRQVEAPTIDGWITTGYAEERILEAALSELNVLHVGCGTTRWGTDG